ncbi:MAG TPA: M48 family metalloprotease [Candidatus Saccharimonadales bacterium]|jgi:heat shock protein HtpX|nr:M48 family metalloprotease [Candidatus Saccharimonadales bacterium]
MYSEIASNKRRTVLIMLCFVVFAAGLAWIFDLYTGSAGLTVAVLIGALTYAVISYFAGGRMSLALNGAVEIQKKDNPRLWRTVENLAITDGLPMPRVYIMNDPAPNAFATGRDPKHSAVAVTAGLLDIMDDQELQGVLAHEMSHIKNYDIRVAMYAFAITAVISILADIIMRMVWFRDDDRENSQVFLILGIVAAILAPIIATMIQLAVSRRREYLADASGALTTRYPEGLASALEKIGQTGSTLKKQNASTAHFFFANPLKGGGIGKLFSTHPPLQDRIARLRKMGTHA